MASRMDPRVLLALALCLAGVACSGRGSARYAPPAAAAAGAPAAAEPPLLRARRGSARSDRWLDIISQYARDKMQSQGGAGAGAGAGEGGVPRPFTIDLPLGGEEGARGVTLPLLVLPLPVRASQECAAGDERAPARDARPPAPHAPPATASRRGGYFVVTAEPEPGRPSDPFRAPEPGRDARPPVLPETASRRGGHFVVTAEPVEPGRPGRPLGAPAEPFPYPGGSGEGRPPPRMRARPPARARPQLESRGRVPPPSARPSARPAADTLPPFAAEATVSSQQILAQFLAQAPLAPDLPPALIGTKPDFGGVDVRGAFPPDSGAGYDDRGSAGGGPRRGGVARGYLPQRQRYARALFEGRDAGEQTAGGFPRGAALGGAERGYLPPDTAPRGGPPRDDAPPRPRFPRSLLLRAELSVPRADYTEPYTAWWDAESGAARVDFHDDGTSTYRMAMPDGRMQQVEVSTDRTGEREVVRCGVGRPRAATPDMRAPVALPDMQLFSFAGHATEGSARAERWTHTARGAAGAGEALTYRHEMMLTRGADDTAKPLRYSVSVDSSVLGANCDGYEHRYLEAREQRHDDAVFHFDLERTCDEREQLDPEAEPEHAARLDPLREFTLPAGDPRHDAGIQRFAEQFERRYVDEVEGAVRKNLYMQHARFVSACNRQDATFQVEVNFLGDRLDVELEVLLGVTFDAADEDERADDFPYSEARVRALASDLPDRFDWRPEGGVTDVRYQGSCSSCWAFAVTGSVEGALFARTRRLVPLAEQVLVDCAHSHGAHGCRGTWPSHAYDYVRDRGMSSQAEYTPYQAKVLQCRDRSVPPVTHISGHVNVTPNSTRALQVAIRLEAPTVVVVDARPKSFLFYKKGVLRDDRCIKGPKKRLNHAVLAVGWATQRGEPHFILKNSYSARWGDQGYVRVHAPSNTCGHQTVPSYALLRTQDVDAPRAGGGAPNDARGGSPTDARGGPPTATRGGAADDDAPDISGPYY